MRFIKNPSRNPDEMKMMKSSSWWNHDENTVDSASVIWGLEPVPALQRHLANTSPAGRRRETSLRHRWVEGRLPKDLPGLHGYLSSWHHFTIFHRLWIFYDFLIFFLFLIILIFMSSISIDFSLFSPFESSIEVTSNSFNFSFHCGAKTCPERPKRPRTSMRRGQGPGGNLPRYQDDRHLSRNSQNMVDQKWSKYCMHCMSWYSSNDSNRFWRDW